MNTVHWVKIVLNALLTVILLTILVVLEKYVQPFQSGFYCNDFSINMKYKSSTVNNSLLVVVSLLGTGILIFMSEIFNNSHIKLNRVFVYSPKNPSMFKIRLFNRQVIEIREHIGNFYVNYGFFIIGFLLNTIVTLIGKKTIGRLRPNFLDVCKPEPNPYVKCGEPHLTGLTYLSPEIDFLCTAIDKEEIVESRLSFPSGHSSTAFYSAVFMICYLNEIWRRRSCSLMLHIVQVFLFAAAFFVAMTRVIDNKHHVTDVIAGSAIGSTVALVTFYYVLQFYRKYDFKIKCNSRRYSEKGSDTFRDDDQAENEAHQLIENKII